MTTRDRVYSVRLSEAEYQSLATTATAKGVNLSDAFREGAKLYLGDQGDIAVAAAELENAVTKAQRILRETK